MKRTARLKLWLTFILLGLSTQIALAERQAITSIQVIDAL